MKVLFSPCEFMIEQQMAPYTFLEILFWSRGKMTPHQFWTCNKYTPMPGQAGKEGNLRGHSPETDGGYCAIRRKTNRGGIG